MRDGSGGDCPDAVLPVLRKEPDPVRQLQWHIYTTDHFEIYYYPELEQHLERSAAYAESAYQQISADLKHDLAFKVPLVLFKTQSEFQQQNIIGRGAAGRRRSPSPSRSAIAWSCRSTSRPIGCYRLITHELTHIFEFDIIPQLARPQRYSALGRRRARRLHGRLLEPDRPHARSATPPSPTSSRR